MYPVHVLAILIFCLCGLPASKIGVDAASTRPSISTTLTHRLKSKVQCDHESKRMRQHTPAFLNNRISSLASQLKKRDVGNELSLSTGKLVVSRIRGGDSDSDSDSGEENESEYDDDFDSGDGYDLEYDSADESDEEEFEIKPTSLKSSLLSKSQQPDVVEYDELLPPPEMQLFAISIGVMVLSNRIDIFNDRAVKFARFAFLGYLCLTQLFLLYVRIRAKVINDRTEISLDNPLASLIPSGEGSNFLVKTMASQILNTKTTVVEYDLQQVSKMNTGLLFPMVLLYFLHFKMKQVQPLIMQTATGVSNLIYSPLFQVYVLGRNVERPFKPKMNDALMKAMGQKSEEVEEENIEEETVTEEPTVEDLDEEKDEGSEEDEEYSDDES